MQRYRNLIMVLVVLFVPMVTYKLACYLDYLRILIFFRFKHKEIFKLIMDNPVAMFDNYGKDHPLMYYIYKKLTDTDN